MSFCGSNILLNRFKYRTVDEFFVSVHSFPSTVPNLFFLSIFHHVFSWKILYFNTHTHISKHIRVLFENKVTHNVAITQYYSKSGSMSQYVNFSRPFIYFSVTFFQGGRVCFSHHVIKTFLLSRLPLRTEPRTFLFIR